MGRKPPAKSPGSMVKSTKIRIWKDREKRQELTFNGDDNKFFKSPQEFFVEGVKPSDQMNDLELYANFTNKEGDKQTRVCEIHGPLGGSVGVQG